MNNSGLIFKWLKSENASSKETKVLANKIRTYLGMTHKEYRKMLSYGREKTKILERLMSSNQWDKIDFSKIPSKAGLVYKNAFARRDMIAKKYETFAKSADTKVNAKTLYPYEVVAKAVGGCSWSYNLPQLSDVDRAMIEKYWNNLPDYLNGAECKMMCVVDTSDSMTGMEAAAPINVAISLGMYCAERIGGAFKNHYISFSSRPQLIKIEGVDFVDKVRRIYKTNLCDNTDLVATFDMLKSIALKSNPSDIPETIVVISDMEIDSGSGSYFDGTNWTKKSAETEMERVRKDWEASGLKCPKLVYWCVESRQNTILDLGENVSLVSGFSPTIFKQVITGKTGWDLCLETILADRYSCIK